MVQSSTRYAGGHLSEPFGLRRAGAEASTWASSRGVLFVVPHDEVSFHLIHKVECDTDYDQQGRAAEVKIHIQAIEQES